MVRTRFWALVLSGVFSSSIVSGDVVDVRVEDFSDGSKTTNILKTEQIDLEASSVSAAEYLGRSVLEYNFYGTEDDTQFSQLSSATLLEGTTIDQPFESVDFNIEYQVKTPSPNAYLGVVARQNGNLFGEFTAFRRLNQASTDWEVFQGSFDAENFVYLGDGVGPTLDLSEGGAPIDFGLHVAAISPDLEDYLVLEVAVDSVDLTITPQAVPEPGSALFLLGLGMPWFMARRRRNS